MLAGPITPNMKSTPNTITATDSPKIVYLKTAGRLKALLSQNQKRGEGSDGVLPLLLLSVRKLKWNNRASSAF